MVSKHAQPVNQQIIDEDWWSALLSDEEKYAPPSGSANGDEPLSRKKGDRTSPASKEDVIDWGEVRRLYESDRVLNLKVSGYNRGGLLVGCDNLHGFVPVSHLVEIPCYAKDIERDELLAGYVGRTIELKVIECTPERGRVVFSERAAQSEAGRRNQIFDCLHAGECVDGTVTNITEFGVFVDLGGVEGLVHVSELSWGRVRHPADVAVVGDLVSVYVIQIDRERGRIALSLKRLHPNPWITAESRYQPGQIVEAVVTSVVSFGAFARLEEGLDGLIHLTEMGGSEPNGRINKLYEGQPVRVRVLNVDASRQRLGLSLVVDE